MQGAPASLLAPARDDGPRAGASPSRGRLVTARTAVGANQGRDVAIVGAGVGGLAAAICLARRGARVTVLERASALREVGAGVQVSPNGHHVLRAMGVSGPVGAAGDRAEAVVLRSGPSGREIVRLPLPLSGRSQWRLLHRADLLGALADAALAAGAEVRLGAAVASVRPTDGRPVVTLEGGERVVPDLLVGADGGRSLVRAALNGPSAPAFAGQTAWRALVRSDGRPEPVSTIHFFPGRHVVTYPLRGGALINVVAVAERPEWAEEGWHHPDDPERLRAAFADAGPALAALLGRVEETHLWGLFRHPVAADWGSRAIALLGDAAHPTLPFLAQGANLALEDAWALAAETDAPASLDRALRSYRDRRRDRAARAVAAAEANARAYHLGGARRVAAHAALRLGSVLAPSLIARRTAWLHEHDETAGEALPPPQASSSTQSGV